MHCQRKVKICIVLWSLCCWTRIHLCRWTEFRTPARLSCDSAQCSELDRHRTASTVRRRLWQTGDVTSARQAYCFYG